jgi:hypothetical protein
VAKLYTVMYSIVDLAKSKTPSYLLVSDDLCLQSLETLNWNVLDKSVHLLSSIFILVSTTAHSNSDSGGEVLDTLGPDELVQVRVDSDILGQHNLLDELLDSSKRSRCSLLEGLLEGHLSQMDGGVPGGWLQTLLSGLTRLGRLSHLRS